MLYVFFPEKFEKIASHILKVLSWVSSGIGKRYVAADLQSRVNESARKLEKTTSNLLPYRLKIKWVNSKSIEGYLKDGQVIVMMRKYNNQSKNLAYATKKYVQMGLLPNARRYIEPILRTAIDDVFCKEIMKDNPDAVEIFSKEIIDPETKENPGLEQKIIMIDEINVRGYLTRILLREFQKLNIIYPKEPSQDIFEETVGTTEMLHRLVAKKPQEKVNPTYSGKYINLVIVPVAKEEVGDIMPHKKFIANRIAQGASEFYIVAAGKLNISLAKYLIHKIIKELHLELKFEDEYSGFYRGQRMSLFCALLKMRAL